MGSACGPLRPKEKLMTTKIECPNEPVNLEVVDDFFPSPEELAALDRDWLEEVQRRSAEYGAGRMKSEERAELDRQLREYEKNPNDGSPWPEVKQRIQRSVEL
jgi:hypothetical protein